MSDDEVLKTESLVRQFAKIIADRIWLMTPKEMKTMDDKIQEDEYETRQK